MTLKYYKPFLLGLSILLLVAPLRILHAQTVFIESSFDANPTPFVYSWDTKPDLLQIAIYAETEMSFQAKLIAEIKDGFGNRIGGNNPAFTQSVTIVPGETILEGSQSVSFGSFIFEDHVRKTLDRTRMLPEGDYQLCFNLVRADNNQPLIEFPSCSHFSIMGFEAPYLVSPANNTRITPDELIFLVFQWTPLMHFDMSQSGIEQNLVITEIFPGQIPEQAIRVNTPVISTCMEADASDYIYHEDMISLPLREYAWSVCTKDKCEGTIIAIYNQVFILVVSEDEGEENDTIVSDPEFPRDPYGMPEACGPPAKQIEKGSPISLGMVLEKADLFKYPRAVPLRAEGIDIDLVKILCAGCEGTESSSDFTVKDEVEQFNWKLLEGKGSLNTPPDMTKILDLQKQIDSLTNALNDYQANLSRLENTANSANTNYEKAISDLAKEMTRLEGEKAGIINEISRIEGELMPEEESLAMMVKERVGKLKLNRETFIESIHSLESQVNSKSERIDYYTGELANNI
ncbi:MAG: hypothetical protein J7L96_01525, partial [Bacteroidales bacterium]|nr:hypothetical protein [Bacteroidales bacterium]